MAALAEGYINGAVNLPFSGFTPASLRAVIGLMQTALVDWVTAPKD